MADRLQQTAVSNVLAGDPRFGPLATLTERLGQLDLSALLVYLVDLVGAEQLPILAEQFHVMGLEGWNAARDEDARRALIKSAIELHRYKGTPWALKRALAPLGLTVDVIDQMMQRAAYAEHGALHVDSSWKLNGAEKIKPLELYAGLPQIQHWAQFIVRINLADAASAENFALVRPLVDEWKPARSLPLFLFWLAFTLQVNARAESALALDKQTAGRYPWPGRVIGDAPDARWTLGRDGEVLRLPQPFGFRLGEKRGGLSVWRLKGERAASTTLMQSSAAAATYRLPKLAELDRRLDGSWRLGARAADTDSRALISTASQIAVHQALTVTQHEHIRLDYPATPARLGATVRLASWRRLDGSWAVGAAREPRPFGFALRRDVPVPVESQTTLTSTAHAYATPERLCLPIATQLATRPRRLDGGWQLGALNRLGRFRLDGRPLRAAKLSASPRLGGFALAHDLPSGEHYQRAPGRRLRLSSGWRVGGPAAPQFTLTITKETLHG